MKKIYLMATLLGATSLAFGQVQQMPAHITKNTEKSISTNGFDKAAGEVVWEDDFSEPSNWEIGQAAGGQQGTWVIGTSSPEGDNYYNVIESTTAANGFAYFEGVGFLLAPPVLAQNAYIAMAESVDLSEHDIVSLKFEHAYRSFNTDHIFVEVSLDGGATWEQGIDIKGSMTANQYHAETVVIRNFTVDNAEEVKFRFRWESLTADNQFGAGYAWQIDDVEIRTLADFDITTEAHEKGTEDEDGDYIHYYKIPTSQIAPISTSITLTNQGSATMTGVALKAELVDGEGTYSSTSTPAEMEPFTSAVVTVEDAFTPTTVGSYTIDYSVIANEEDDVPSNNTLNSYTFEVTDFLYARDRSAIMAGEILTGNFSQLTGANDPNENAWYQIATGNYFVIENTVDVYAIDFVLGNKFEEGATVFGNILDPSDLSQISNGESMEYIIKADDGGKYITLQFENPVTLTPGAYVASVSCPEPKFSVAVSGTSAASTSFIFTGDDETWYYTTSTPIVRLNFDETVSIANNELNTLNVTQFPNPFANETTVKFNLQDASEVSYTVVDVTGKVVASSKAGKLMAGEHQITIDGTSFANGIYYLNLNADNSQVTHKMVVNK